MIRVTVDPAFCLGRKDCIVVCPEHVFGWRKAQDVGWATRIKLAIESRGYQAWVARPEACTACMACVAACPEGAIEVVDDHAG